MSMILTIDYDSTWRNSFLGGSNNEPIPKDGRPFITSSTPLSRDPKSQIARTITTDTIMGVLNRLIGDQRKLYQSRLDESYYFKDMESEFTNSHIHDVSELTDSLIFIRNMTGNRDKNDVTGLIIDDHPALTSSFSKTLWSVPYLTIEQVIAYILSGTFTAPDNAPEKPNPVDITLRFNEINRFKAEKLTEDNLEWKAAIDELSARFPDIKYSLTKADAFRPVAFYASAMYLLLDQLAQAHDVTSALSPRGGLSGISKRSFSQGDFIQFFATGSKKIAYGNPYLIEKKTKGVRGIDHKKLTTASGTVTVTLPLNTKASYELKERIDNAGVSAFPLGKKGLAYVRDITIDGVTV